MNYILGSGLVAFIAKTMYPDYHLIPVGKSRYYQYDAAICDDYIFCHKDVDEVVESIVRSFIPVMFKRAISYNGQLIFNCDSPFMNNWANKAYNNNPHPRIKLSIQDDGFVYNCSCIDLFKKLEQKCISTCKDFILQQEKITQIDHLNRVVHTNKRLIEYDKLINTTPLNYILKLMGIENSLECLDLHTIIVETESLDFEGASELLVADANIDFYKCTFLGNNRYQFYSTKEIPDISSYLRVFMDRFDIISGTCVKEAVPVGDPSQYESMPGHIVNVGSNAQWDDGMDMSSCIRRLKRVEDLFND